MGLKRSEMADMMATTSAHLQRISQYLREGRERKEREGARQEQLDIRRGHLDVAERGIALREQESQAGVETKRQEGVALTAGKEEFSGRPGLAKLKETQPYQAEKLEGQVRGATRIDQLKRAEVELLELLSVGHQAGLEEAAEAEGITEWRETVPEELLPMVDAYDQGYRGAALSAFLPKEEKEEEEEEEADPLYSKRFTEAVKMKNLFVLDENNEYALDQFGNKIPVMSDLEIKKQLGISDEQYTKMFGIEVIEDIPGSLTDTKKRGKQESVQQSVSSVREFVDAFMESNPAVTFQDIEKDIEAAAAKKGFDPTELYNAFLDFFQSPDYNPADFAPAE